MSFFVSSLYHIREVQPIMYVDYVINQYSGLGVGIMRAIRNLECSLR